MKSCVLVIVAGAQIVAGKASAADDEIWCRLYEEPGFRGHSLELGIDGKREFDGDTFWNDQVSSLRTHAGGLCFVTVYDGPGMFYDEKNRSENLSGDLATLDMAWDNQITSVACYCPSD
ncbi:MAG: hypothetical protein AB7S80_19360 [Rhizobiaceae bacterium]